MVAAFPQTSALPAKEQRAEVLGRTDDGAALVVVWPPANCGSCERPHCFFVNRGGTSSCVGCDTASQTPEAV